MKKLACLHAHHSNINYIDKILNTNDLIVEHFVDPGLMNIIKNDPKFDFEVAKAKVHAQLSWIEQGKPDAILITCTNYIALMNEEIRKKSVPYIYIDEPFFKSICMIQEPQILLFTNPDTVKGTIHRLNQYVQANKKTVRFEPRVLPNAFRLLMNGNKKEHDLLLAQYIEGLIINETKQISVAQLSMVDVAKQLSSKFSVPILNPLDVLADAILNSL